jgi:hypothetical protein
VPLLIVVPPVKVFAFANVSVPVPLYTNFPVLPTAEFWTTPLKVMSPAPFNVNVRVVAAF